MMTVVLNALICFGDFGCYQPIYKGKMLESFFCGVNRYGTYGSDLTCTITKNEAEFTAKNYDSQVTMADSKVESISFSTYYQLVEKIENKVD